MKKHLIYAISCLVAFALLVACGNAPQATSLAYDNNKLTVITSIFPQYDFMRQIAGDKISLVMLLPPGTESHAYEPTAQDILAVQNCDIFITVGGESEAWIDTMLQAVDTNGITLVSLLDIVQAVPEVLIDGMEDEGVLNSKGHDETEEPELDEHVWASPKNAITIVNALCDTLCKLDEANADFYRTNANSYVAQLGQLHSDFEEVVANGARNTIVVGDRFPFRYLADAYDLDYYAAFPGCSTQTEASAATVAFLIDKVREDNIPVVFNIEYSNGKMADTICTETGAKKLMMHSCHTLSAEDLAAGATYLSLMQQNLLALKEALA